MNLQTAADIFVNAGVKEKAPEQSKA